MELFGSYTSPFVRHCRVVLLETEQTFDFVETDHAASAERVPTKRVPFLRDGDLSLTDSSSILKYLREKAGQTFMKDVVEYDRYCLVNTALDSTVNLFMLERTGVTPEQSAYLERQKARVEAILDELNSLSWPAGAPYNDAELRLACYLEWGLFRERLALDGRENLVKFLEGAKGYQPFADTAPR